MEKLEKLLEWGGWKKDAALLAASGAALALSLAGASPCLLYTSSRAC